MKTTKEKRVAAINGWVMLIINIALGVTSIGLLIFGLAGGEIVWAIVVSLVLMVLTPLSFVGHFTLQPNEARVLILFGAYRGTVVDPGFHWANPFYTRAFTRISLRARNFDGERLKVNDKRGNPIEISTVVVWRVSDTAKAKFDVDDYEKFVHVQSESALRHLANGYAYDHGASDDADVDEITLRSGAAEISVALQVELRERLDKAGVEIDEARLNHLAYAPEIAGAMLRRQQAEAIIAARRKIVHGAVSMVEMALEDLAAKHVVELDEERKAAMVSNLLVVLCGETEAHPVINTGSLYT